MQTREEINPEAFLPHMPLFVPLTTLSASNAARTQMSRICSTNADVAYLFRPLGLFFTDKVSQYRQRTRVGGISKLKRKTRFLFNDPPSMVEKQDASKDPSIRDDAAPRAAEHVSVDRASESNRDRLRRTGGSRRKAIDLGGCAVPTSGISSTSLLVFH
jgi:hypothetical protein